MKNLGRGPVGWESHKRGGTESSRKGVRRAELKELVKVFEEEVFRDVEELEKSGFKISHDGLNRLLDEREEPVIYRHGRYPIICL